LDRGTAAALVFFAEELRLAAGLVVMAVI